jgi:hypothetical protein
MPNLTCRYHTSTSMPHQPLTGACKPHAQTITAAPSPVLLVLKAVDPADGSQASAASVTWTQR